VDVATLVAALALGATPIAVPAVAPNVMHALIWEQSRGSPGRSRPPTNCAAGVPQRPVPHRIDELADLAAYTVNVASRLLEIAKDRHAEIVISEDLYLSRSNRNTGRRDGAPK
jgi:class 3 adenylate cyclase